MTFWIYYLAILIVIAGRYRWSFAENWLSEEQVNKWRLNLAILIIIVLSAIRYDVGADWKNYEFIVNGYKFGMIDYRDALPSLIFWLSAKFDYSTFLTFLTLSIVTYGSIGLWIKKESKTPYLTLMLYFCLFYLRSLSIIREAAAIAIIIWGYRYIKEKNIWKYILVCVIAALFHKYALLAISFYVVYYLPSTALFGLLLFFGVGMQVLIAILPKISFLADSSLSLYLLKFANFGGMMYAIFYLLILLVVALLILWRWRTKKDISDEIAGTFKICLVGVALPFIIGTHTGGRVADYFLIYLIVLIPLVLEEYSIFFQKIIMIVFYLYYIVLVYMDAFHGSSVFTPYNVYYWLKL